jgi:excisionase family DNA binding protein
MGAADDSSKLVVTLTQSQLCEIVKSAVRDVLDDAHEPPQFLTLDQAAELLQASTRSVRTWVNEEGLPALRAGSEYRFRRESIVAWLEARAIKPGAHVSKTVARLKRAKGEE